MDLSILQEQNWPKLGPGAPQAHTKIVFDFAKKISTIVLGLSKKIELLEANEANRNQNPDTIKSMFSDLFKTNNKATAKPNKVHQDIIHAITKEQESTKDRENNLIILGVENSPSNEKDQPDDENKVNEIFDELKLEKQNIKSVYRFQKNKDSTYPGAIKVTLTDNYRNTVLKASNKLRTVTNYSKVYINADLTPTQRANEKQLIIDRNDMNAERIKSEKPEDKTFYFGIKGSQIIKKKITPTAELLSKN